MSDSGPRAINGDIIAGLVLLAFTAFCLWLTTGFREVPAMLSQNVPPTFFPRLVLSLIAMLSVVLIVSGLRGQPGKRDPVGERVLPTAVFVLLTPFSIGLLGTLPTIALVTLCLPLLWRERRWHLIALLTVGLPIFVYVVFAIVLELRFPAGRIATLFA